MLGAGARRSTRLLAGLLVAAALAVPLPAAAQRRGQAPGRSMSDLARDVVRAMEDYRAVLAGALPAYEAALAEATQALDERQDLHDAGVLDARFVQEAEQAWRAARRELDAHRAAMREADRILFTASVHERLARLAPLPANRYEDAGGFVRFNGRAAWSPAKLPGVATAFARVFGHEFTVSAYGQTALHTRLRLDHRDAVDVAVHPDSTEGRWLLGYLREAGIPFVGVRDAMPGSSTGPHIHIGAPSPRFLPR